MNIIKSLIIVALASVGLASIAMAEPAPGVMIYNPNNGSPCIVGNTGCGLGITGSVTASFGAFAPAGTNAITASTTSAAYLLSGSSANGTVLVANTGTNAAYVAFGTSGVTATTSSALVPAGWAIAFSNGTNTYIAAITASSTTTLAVTSGVGLPALTGGGSGSGGGGAVTVADGADVTLGAKADTYASGYAGTYSSIALLKGVIYQLSQLVSNQTNAVTVNQGTTPWTVGDASGAALIQATTSKAITATTATTTQLVALSGTTSIYVTHLHLVTAAAATWALVYGTGTNCGTGTTYLDGASGNTISQAANGEFVAGSGLGPVYVVPSGQALCIVTGTATTYAGSLTYAQF